ncbi:MAG: hypothetical protein ACRDJO_13540 [Actinomycetota bacterium]
MGKAKKPKLAKMKMKIAGKKAKRKAGATAKKVGIPALLALAAGGAAFKMKKSGGRWRPFKLVTGDGGGNGASPARPATPAEGAKAPMAGAAGEQPKAAAPRAEPAAPKAAAPTAEPAAPKK